MKRVDITDLAGLGHKCSVARLRTALGLSRGTIESWIGDGKIEGHECDGRSRWDRVRVDVSDVVGVLFACGHIVVDGDSVRRRCWSCRAVKDELDFNKTSDGQWTCKECDNARSKAYSEANPREAAERKRNWRLNNPEKHQAGIKRRYARAKAEGRHLNHKHRYRARKLAVAREDTSSVYTIKASGKVVVCAYCGKRIPAAKSHIDHIIPISRGGADMIHNLTIACARCNISKGAKTPSEWRGGQIEMKYN